MPVSAEPCSSSSTTIGQHIRLQRPRNHRNLPLPPISGADEPLIPKPSRVCKSAMSSFFLLPTSNETTRKKPNGFSQTAPFRGLGCTTSASQQVSVPAVIRSSADWDASNFKIKKTKKNKKKNRGGSSYNGGSIKILNEASSSSSVGCAAIPDVWCGPGLGFSTDAVVGGSIDHADSDPPRRNIPARRKIDGDMPNSSSNQREGSSLLPRRSLNQESNPYFDSDSTFFTSRADQIDRYHRHLRQPYPDGLTESYLFLEPKSMADEEQQPLVGLQKKLQEKKHTRKLRRLKYSCEEVYERMDNGLCIFCDELDTPGHHDLKHKGIQIFMVDDDQVSGYEEEAHQVHETLTNPAPIEKNVYSEQICDKKELVSIDLDQEKNRNKTVAEEKLNLSLGQNVEHLVGKHSETVSTEFRSFVSLLSPDEYQKDSTVIESSNKDDSSLSHKDDRVWEPGGLPTNWDWKELKPYGESHMIQEPEPLELADSIFEVDFVHSQEFPSQCQVPIPSLEPSRRCQKESLAVIYDLSCDLGYVIGKTIGSICDSELGQDNSHDEEELIGLNLGKLLKNERLFSIICLLGLNEMSCWTQLLRQQIFPKSWRFKFKTESSGEAILLKQHDDSVETYLVKFERVLSRLSLPVAHALNIFLTNMSFHLASHVRQLDVTTAADAVWIAKRRESSLLQHPSATQSRAPFIPYQSYNDQPYYERKFGECPEIEFDRESDEIKDVKLQDKQPEEDVKTLVISENEQSLECVGDEPFDDEKPGEVTVEDIIDKSVDKIREKKLTPENESSPEVSLQILLSQFQVSLSSLEPGRRYHKESLVVVNDLSSDLGCVIGKIIGCICDSEIGQDNSLDEEEFNRVWEPGGVVLIELDKWKGSEKCYELSRVVRLMQGLPSRRWSYGKVAELTQEVQQPKTCLKEIKLKELDRLVTCSSVGYIVALLMVYDAERLIQSDVPPIFSDLLCVKNRIQGRLKMVLLLEFLWLILFTFKMFKSSNVPQNKNQTDQKLSSYWKLLLSWKIISNIHVSSRCVLRQEESYVKVLELIKDRDSRKRKLCKNWWFKYKLYTWLSEALHLWRKRKYEKLQILGRATHGLLLKQNFSQVLLHIQNRDYSFFGYMLVATSLVETENIYSFSVKGTHMEGEIMGFKLLLTSGLNWKTFIEWVKIYFSEKQYQENTRLMRSATTKLIRSDFCHLFVRKIHVIGALHNFEKTVAATKVNQNSETSQDCYLLLFLERVKASFEIKFTMEQSEKPLITILSYEWFHSPRPPELACCKEDEESTAKFSYLRTSMFSSREYCDRVYLNHTTLTHFYL